MPSFRREEVQKTKNYSAGAGAGSFVGTFGVLAAAGGSFSFEGGASPLSGGGFPAEGGVFSIAGAVFSVAGGAFVGTGAFDLPSSGSFG
ncbi:MAG: hypothetical protein KA250_19170, partial [Verrucomicrobiales bacterium]|nr:hypothetical protein [Verrucomicrobiales bacterium]